MALRPHSEQAALPLLAYLQPLLGKQARKARNCPLEDPKANLANLPPHPLKPLRNPAINGRRNRIILIAQIEDRSLWNPSPAPYGQLLEEEAKVHE